MSVTVRVQVLGGFLGSGKTTAVIALARHFARQGHRVAAITNDHGDIAFDAKTIKAEAIDAREISEGCLCCRFRDFLYAADDLLGSVKPDIVLAEPVGTILDLPRGLLLPLCRYAGERYTVGALSVLIDPQRFQAMNSDTNFDPSVRYLYQQQLNEADILVLNKSDILSASDRRRLLETLSTEYPAAKTFVVSALKGEGIEEWGRYLLDTAWSETPQDSRVDYEEYRRGESKLGYVDAVLRWESSGEFDAVAVVRGIIALLQDRLGSLGIPVAHMKVAVGSDKEGIRVNWTGGEDTDWTSFPCGSSWRDRMAVTIRAQGDPEQIEDVFRCTVRDVSELQRLEPAFESMAAFRPRPLLGGCST